MARLNPWRWVVLGLAALYFLVPLASSVIFTVDVPGQGVTFDAYTQIVSTDGFVSSLLLSLELALATIAIVLLLMVPAMAVVMLFRLDEYTVDHSRHRRAAAEPKELATQPEG